MKPLETPDYSLDRYQHPAAESSSPRTLVLGGTGTGKTQVMIGRILHLLRAGVSSDDMVAITFTNQTVLAFRERLGNLPPPFAEAAGKIFVGTPHLFANSLLRQGGAAVSGLPNTYTLWDRADAVAVISETWARRPGGEQLDPETIARMLEWHGRNLARQGLPQLPAPAGEWEEIIRHYEEEKRRRRTVDVDDLVPMATKALADPGYAHMYRVGMPALHLLVDGVQDATEADRNFLDMVAGQGGHRFVGWDPNQTIDASLGRSPASPWDLLEETATEQHHIRFDHRSSQKIGAAARTVAADEQVVGLVTDRGGSVRIPGTPPVIRRFYNDELATEFVRGELHGLRDAGYRWGDVAVICRDPADVELFRAALEGDSIPCATWDQKISPPPGPGRRIVALLTSVLNPVDTRAFAIAAFGDGNLPEIVVRQVCEVLDQNVRSQGTDLFQAGWPLYERFRLGSAVPQALVRMTRAKGAIDAALGKPDVDLASLIGLAGDLLGISPGDDAGTDIDGLLRAAESMPRMMADSHRMHLARFLDNVNRDLHHISGSGGERVTIGTVHACRGLGWRGVIFIDGDVPGEGRSQEEENRVRFAGITRAADTLSYVALMHRFDVSAPGPHNFSDVLNRAVQGQ